MGIGEEPGAAKALGLGVVLGAGLGWRWTPALGGFLDSLEPSFLGSLGLALGWWQRLG